jgi:hypothetical protein
MRARVFLSYARNDGTTACDFFQRALQNAGYSVWRDIDDLGGGTPWRQVIEDTIRNVDVVLLFVTAEAIASKNVEEEWRTALRFQKRIVPLRLDDTSIPAELLSYNYRDIRNRANYELEPSNVQKDLEEERGALRSTFDQLRADLASRIADPAQRRYLEPFADYLRMVLDAEPVALPPEVLRMMFSLLSRLLSRLADGDDITPLVESMADGTYSNALLEEEAIYRIRIGDAAQILKRVRDAIPSIPVQVVVVAMSRADAEDLDSGRVFTGLPPEWQQNFSSIRPDLPPNWLRHYGDKAEDWEPFVGEGSISSLIRNELQLLSQASKTPLRASFVEIRDLSQQTHRQKLLDLRAGGCLVVMDAVSAWHPQLQAAFRASSLDVSPMSMVVRILPHQTLDSVLTKVGFLLREWLSCEFFQRANIDLDEKCETVMQPLAFRKWMRNRLRDVAPAVAAAQKGSLRPHINNFGH